MCFDRTKLEVPPLIEANPFGDVVVDEMELDDEEGEEEYTYSCLGPDGLCKDPTCPVDHSEDPGNAEDFWRVDFSMMEDNVEVHDYAGATVDGEPMIEFVKHNRDAWPLSVGDGVEVVVQVEDRENRNKYGFVGDYMEHVRVVEPHFEQMERMKADHQEDSRYRTRLVERARLVGMDLSRKSLTAPSWWVVMFLTIFLVPGANAEAAGFGSDVKIGPSLYSSDLAMMPIPLEFGGINHSPNILWKIKGWFRTSDFTTLPHSCYVNGELDNRALSYALASGWNYDEQTLVKSLTTYCGWRNSDTKEDSNVREPTAEEWRTIHNQLWWNAVCEQTRNQVDMARVFTQNLMHDAKDLFGMAYSVTPVSVRYTINFFLMFGLVYYTSRLVGAVWKIAFCVRYYVAYWICSSRIYEGMTRARNLMRRRQLVKQMLVSYNAPVAELDKKFLDEVKEMMSQRGVASFLADYRLESLASVAVMYPSDFARLLSMNWIDANMSSLGMIPVGGRPLRMSRVEAVCFMERFKDYVVALRNDGFRLEAKTKICRSKANRKNRRQGLFRRTLESFFPFKTIRNVEYSSSGSDRTDESLEQYANDLLEEAQERHWNAVDDMLEKFKYSGRDMTLEDVERLIALGHHLGDEFLEDETYYGMRDQMKRIADEQTDEWLDKYLSNYDNRILNRPAHWENESRKVSRHLVKLDTGHLNVLSGRMGASTDAAKAVLQKTGDDKIEEFARAQEHLRGAATAVPAKESAIVKNGSVQSMMPCVETRRIEFRRKDGEVILTSGFYWNQNSKESKWVTTVHKDGGDSEVRMDEIDGATVIGVEKLPVISWSPVKDNPDLVILTTKIDHTIPPHRMMPKLHLGPIKEGDTVVVCTVAGSSCGKVVSAKDGQVFHTATVCDEQLQGPGTSGSPVLIQNGGSYRALGYHEAGCKGAGQNVARRLQGLVAQKPCLFQISPARAGAC